MATNDNDTALVRREASTLERAAMAIIALAFVSFVLSWTTLGTFTPYGGAVFGIPTAPLFGVLTLLMGGSVLVFGLASYSGVVSTSPDRTAGLVTAIALGLVGFIVGGLVASQTLGLGGTINVTLADLAWFVPAVIVGLAAGAVTLFPREDLGSTLLPGLLGLFVGLLVLTGVFDPAFVWKPAGLSATFTAGVAVPIMTIFLSLLCGWSAGKASGGFGARGRESGAYLLIRLNAFGMVAVLALLILFVASKGWGPVFDGFRIGPGLQIQWPFVTHGYTFKPDVPNGVYPAIVGTFWLVIGTVIMAVPLGVGAAVFLTEYAEQGRFTQVVEVATNGLWSTPSIVFGLFGYAFLVPRLGNQPSLLSGMVVLAFMLIPLVLITSREAIKSVPDEYRDASAALGVTHWQTVRSVVLPASIPGVITGVILGVGRIAGETAPILLVMTGGLREGAPKVLASFQFGFWFWVSGEFPFVHVAFKLANPALFDSSLALPYQLYAIITAGVSGSQSFGWGTAFVLLIVVLSFYAVGIASRKYFRKKLNQE